MRGIVSQSRRRWYWECLFCLVFLVIALEVSKIPLFVQEYSVTLLLLKVKLVRLLRFCRI